MPKQPKPPGVRSRPRSKKLSKKAKANTPNLTQLARRHPSSKQHAAIQDAIHRGPPIAAACLGQASLEVEVERLLKGRLPRKDDATWDRITDEPAPLSTFHQKTMMAYALGLYDRCIEKNLDVVRRIRNGFAHARSPITFNHAATKRELKKVSLPEKTKSKLYKDLAKVRDMPYGPRTAFVSLVQTLLIQLLKRQVKLANASHKRRRKQLARLLSPPPTTGLGLLGAAFLDQGIGAGVQRSPLLLHTDGPSTPPPGIRHGGLFALAQDAPPPKKK